MTKFEEETRHWSYVFIRKKTRVNSQKKERLHTTLKGLTNDG